MSARETTEDKAALLLKSGVQYPELAKSNNTCAQAQIWDHTFSLLPSGRTFWLVFLS